MNPTGSVTDVSADNVITITFSKPVKFIDYDIMKSNLNTFIDGPKTPYSYSYLIFNQNELATNQTFTKLLISIVDIKATLYGNNR